MRDRNGADKSEITTSVFGVTAKDFPLHEMLAIWPKKRTYFENQDGFSRCFRSRRHLSGEGQRHAEQGNARFKTRRARGMGWRGVLFYSWAHLHTFLSVIAYDAGTPLSSSPTTYSPFPVISRLTAIAPNWWRSCSRGTACTAHRRP